MSSSKTADLHSKSNVQARQSELDLRRLYSLSLSRIRTHSEFGDFHYKPSPFNVRWIHGYNPKVGVINLNGAGSTIAFYAASNCAVLYNWTAHQMMILQGHKHMITCIASDAVGKWLVTADSGPENVIIIWDRDDLFPQRTLFNPHGNTRLAKVIISADAKYLLTLGYHEKTKISWWIWSFGLDYPHASLDVNIPKGGVVDMLFNPSASDQFVLMTKTDIWIGISAKIFVTERGILKETDDYELKIRLPENKITPDHGRLMCFAFVQDTSQIVIGTSKGCVLIYGYTMEYQENVDRSNFENLKFVKVLKIDNNKINVIKSIDGVVVTGNTIGEIHFYDNHMKLLYWVHGFQLDSIKELSFNISPRSYKIIDPKCGKKCLCWEKVVTEVDPKTGAVKQKLLKMDIPSDATPSGKPFLVRDFIVCSYNQGVGFVDFVTEKLKTVLDNKIYHALTVSVHPDKPFLCIGYANGLLEMFNYLQHKLFKRVDLRDRYKVIIPPKEDSINGECEVQEPQLSVTCVKYAPSGLHLACGLNTGQLIFVHPATLEILSKAPHKDTNHAISIIDFSCDSLTMAFADKNRTVGVYKLDCKEYVWNFIGKHRAHYKDITTLIFLPKLNPNGEYKLISMGLDRIMVEYDVGESSDEYLQILSLDRMDQTAVPLTAIPWPMPKNLDPKLHRTDLPLILIATDEFKYKILNYDTTMTLSTVLGPRYETSVCKVQLITRKVDESQPQYLVYATKNVVGLQKMPLDGNPWKHAGILGHPVQVIDMCFHEGSGMLFTIGSKDNCVIQWAANYRAVDTTTKQGGGNLDPYYCLIENGRPGWLFQEIRDLFYYIQILCQGTFSPAMRRVKDHIPIDSLPDMMRALGYFPSEYEVENLLVEAKYKVYQREPSTEIDFEEFVKLYLNHRPTLGDSFLRIKNAFRHFADVDRDSYFIYREDFQYLLSNHGECFSPELSWYLLSILCGHTFEDRATLVEGNFSFLPEKITLDDLITNMMGIQDVELMPEQHSTRSFGSIATESTLS